MHCSNSMTKAWRYSTSKVTLFAIDDSCPHQGASLCGGRLEGRVIQCCAHGLRFDLRSGYLLNSTAVKVANYPVEIIDGQAFIVIVPEESAP